MSSEYIKEEENKWIKVKKLLEELALTTSAHGLPKIIKKKKLFFKIMWLLFLLICISFGIYFVITTIINYFSYEVVVQIKQIKEIPTEFPTISIHFRDDYYGNKTLNDRLMRCKFNDIECNSSDFEINQKSDGYSYVKFNSGKPIKNSQLSGRSNGFSAVFFTGLENNPLMLPIYIHNHTLNPVVTSEHPFYLSVGFEYNIKVKRVFYLRKEIPYSNCISSLNNVNDFNSILFKHMILNDPYKYKQSNCYDLCYSNFLIEKCNILAELKYTWFLFRELNDTSSKCINEKKSIFFALKINEYCGNDCPLECDTIEYNFESSFTVYPYNKNETEELISKNQILKSLYRGNYENISQSLVSMHIFYDDLSYTIITENAKILLVDLVSDIGGLLGLFIGISLLSFGEFFELILEIILIIFDKK